MSNTSRNRQRKSRVDRLEQGTRGRTDHLLDRVSAIENAIVRLHRARCPCGSNQTVNQVGDIETVTGKEIGQSYGIGHYTHGEIRCFYCHRLLEAYGVGG